MFNVEISVGCIDDIIKDVIHNWVHNSDVLKKYSNTSIILNYVISIIYSIIFFFQAEDGIRDYKVTGVQTCALPISQLALACQNAPRWPGGAAGHRAAGARKLALQRDDLKRRRTRPQNAPRRREVLEIGRASCRERV